MNKLLLAMMFVLAVRNAAADETSAVRTFEGNAAATAQNPIDDCVQAALRQRGIEPANLCSDEVFIRRVYVDVIGTLPDSQAALAFSRTPARQARHAD